MAPSPRLQSALENQHQSVCCFYSDSPRQESLQRKVENSLKHHCIASRGRIVKVVVFELNKTGKWNLGFGDFTDDFNIDDKIISNNQDVFKVISTVAKIAYQFLESYPDSIISIVPVDGKRKMLYNRVFQRHFEEIEQQFEVTGTINEHDEPYLTTKLYDAFSLKFKTKSNGND